jgi:hypothetical protein
VRIRTPDEVAALTQNKYLGVLVAARFARFVNEFPATGRSISRRS